MRKYLRDLEKQAKRDAKEYYRPGGEYRRDRGGDWVPYSTYGYDAGYPVYPTYSYRTYNYSTPDYGYYNQDFGYYDQYPQYQYYPQYEPVYQRVSWAEQILGVVVSSFLGDRFGGFLGSPYGDPYWQDDYAYTDGRYYYSVYPQPGDYYSPDLYVYNPVDNYYPVQQFGLYSGGANDLLPFMNIFSPYSDGYTDDIARQAYSYGYEQGYIDGQNAAMYRSREASYYDPYVYPDRGYDLYSVSLAEHRQLLSAAYERGYQDAIYGRDQYAYNDEYAYDNGYGYGDDGNVDLVSLLLTGVLSMLDI